MELKHVVVKWLLEKEKADYHQGVMLMMKAGAPTFGLQSESDDNRIKVRRALQVRLKQNHLNGEVSAKVVRTKIVQYAKEIPDGEFEDLGDIVEMSTDARLQIDKRNLVNERLKLSNAFHTCNSDSERKRVYVKLMSVESAHQEQVRKIKYFKETGKALEEVTDIPATTLPDDPVSLMSIRNNLRSNRSKKLKVMETFPKNHVRNIKAHQQYVDISSRLDDVEEKLKTY